MNLSNPIGSNEAGEAVSLTANEIDTIARGADHIRFQAKVQYIDTLHSVAVVHIEPLGHLLMLPLNLLPPAIVSGDMISADIIK